MDRGPWQCTVHGVAKVGHELTTKHHQQQQMYRCKIPTLKKKKKWNPANCNNLDEPGGHFTKWNKQDTLEEILHDFMYMWNLK